MIRVTRQCNTNLLTVLTWLQVASMESIGDTNGNLDTYKQQAKQILKKLDQRSPTKCSIESGTYTFQYVLLPNHCGF